MRREYMQMAAFCCHLRNVQIGRCKNYMYLVFFRGLICNPGKLNNIGTDQIVFWPNFEKWWFDLNVGTTCLYVCEALKSKRNITVVTNSISILNSLLNTPSITVIFLGGIVNSDMQITTGDDVVDQLAKYTADKLFLGMDGVDAEMGATTYNHIEDAIIRQMIQHAKEKILVVDDSKIGKVTFARVAHLSDFDAIITNQNEEKAQEMEKIAAMGVRVIYA